MVSENGSTSPGAMNTVGLALVYIDFPMLFDERRKLRSWLDS